MYIAAGGPWLLIGIGGGLAGVGVISMIPKLLHGYQMDRITIWLNPGTDAQGKGYNIIQSLIAFASGGFSGTGYGGSIQKLAYLPECHTDFIFSIIEVLKLQKGAPICTANSLLSELPLYLGFRHF